MTRTRVPPVLVTGATGRVGRVVVDLLIDAGVPVRALTHRAEAAATLPANVEVVTGDLTVPESLDAGLRGVDAVFLGSSPRGAQRSEGRRSSPLRCSTSSDRRRDRFASGPPTTPPRLWKVQPHRVDPWVGGVPDRTSFELHLPADERPLAFDERPQPPQGWAIFGRCIGTSGRPSKRPNSGSLPAWARGASGYFPMTRP
jgi:NAD(P)H-binding